MDSNDQRLTKPEMLRRLDIEVYDRWGDGCWAQAKYLVHGRDDVMWTNSVDAALAYLRSDLLVTELLDRSPSA
jgi:hypothetical protein